MQVLASLATYPPTTHIGAYIATHKYLAALAARGHHVTVLISHHTEPYEHEGVHVRYEEGHLFSQATSNRIIISHIGDSNKGHRVAAMAGKRSVRFCHGMIEDFDARTSPDGVKPDLVVFNSHALEISSGYTGPSMVCHPQIDPEEYATSPGEHITLINLLGEKGVGLFDQLARHLPNHKFLGVQGGYGDQRKLHRPNLTVIPRTNFIRDDVYAQTRILLMPSEFESWGMVGVEAMCSGIPVIASPCEGIIEALGAAGTFLDPKDLDAWCDEIERLGDPFAYQAASQAAFDRVAELAEDDARERFCDAMEALGS